MKKFIAAFDGLRFSESTLRYAIDLSKKAGAHLVGIILEDPHLHGYNLAELQNYSGESFEGHLRSLNRMDDERRVASINSFRHACSIEGVESTVHRDRNTPLQELLHESIYADLLVIKATERMRDKPEAAPSTLVRALLQDVLCPVLLVPDHYRPFQEVKLLYDGAPESVHALRAFSHLFDNANLPTEIITVKSSDANEHLPDARLIREFAKRHFPGADFTVLKGSADDAILRYLRLEKKEALLVLGTRRRGVLARLFHASLAEQLLQQLKMPLFIAPTG